MRVGEDTLKSKILAHLVAGLMKRLSAEANCSFLCLRYPNRVVSAPLINGSRDRHVCAIGDWIFDDESLRFQVLILITNGTGFFKSTSRKIY